MRNKLVLSRIFALFIFLSIGFSMLNAQNLPYEVVTRNGQTYYRYEVQQGEGLLAISRIFSVLPAEILRHNPDASSGLRRGQELFIPAGVVADNGVGNSISEGQVLTIPQRRVISEVREENYRYHTILPRETVFSVSRTYSLRPEDVMAANPGLSAETFQIGRTIRIPFFESNENITPFQPQTENVKHTVQRGETFFSLSQRYGVDVDEIRRANLQFSDGLIANTEVVIPVRSISLEGDARNMELEAARLLSANPQSQRVDVMKIALLLPFHEETENRHLRLQEYYEGFLLAALNMKNAGANLEIYTFEIGQGDDTRKLESLLGTLEMQSLNLIIGGTTDAQVRVISDFARAYNIKYVVPFLQNNREVLNNSQIFQVNQQPHTIALKASNEFIRLFNNARIVFVTGGENNQMDFVNQLQGDLRRNNIPFETIVATNELDTALRPLLSSTQENVIVPTTDEQGFLRIIVNELEEVKEANARQTIRLFGYPNWQTFIPPLLQRLHPFGTYIYSSFYVDNTNPDTRAFNDSFRRWYDRAPRFHHPSFAMWGYDTGLYFMTALHRHGLNFEQYIHQLRVPTLQHAFYFERANNWGGFTNTGMYLIHFDTNGTVQKIDRSR